METVPRLLSALGALALFGSAASAADSPTHLRVTVWPEGRQVAKVHLYTLACAPARGTVPHPARACTVLARHGARAFAPTPRTSVCTELYGGPAQAHVFGIVAGRRVDARLRLTNGCEIARWNRIRSIVPR
jgi:subtilisin inhibitor-like